jgi:four helix bundle protein
MNTKTFENLYIWQESKNIFIDLYKLVSKNDFKDYFFKDQLLRASLSISNNIAEWFERETKKEFVRFLYISKWSCWEVRNMMIIWKELWYFDEFLFNKVSENLYKISWWLQNLIKNNLSEK